MANRKIWMRDVVIARQVLKAAVSEDWSVQRLVPDLGMNQQAEMTGVPSIARRSCLGLWERFACFGSSWSLSLRRGMTLPAFDVSLLAEKVGLREKLL